MKSCERNSLLLQGRTCTTLLCVMSGIIGLQSAFYTQPPSNLFPLTNIIKRSAKSPHHICLNKLAEKSTEWKHNTAKEEGTVLQRKWKEELYYSVLKQAPLVMTGHVMFSALPNKLSSFVICLWRWLICAVIVQQTYSCWQIVDLDETNLRNTKVWHALLRFIAEHIVVVLFCTVSGQ